MQICTDWSCLLPGIVAILVAIAIFYIIGLFVGRNNGTKKTIKDKEYRATRSTRPTRLQEDAEDFDEPYSDKHT